MYVSRMNAEGDCEGVDYFDPAEVTTVRAKESRVYGNTVVKVEWFDQTDRRAGADVFTAPTGGGVLVIECDEFAEFGR